MILAVGIASNYHLDDIDNDKMIAMDVSRIILDLHFSAGVLFGLDMQYFLVIKKTDEIRVSVHS